MRELDPTIHQPARLRILMLLSGAESADFTFLQQTLGLSKGNLSTHMARLAEKGYITVTKSFRGRMPHTSYQLTEQGRTSLATYWEAIDAIRSEG